MSVKTIRIRVTGTGSFDGNTPFDLPDDLELDPTTSIIDVEYADQAVGRLSRGSMNALVGSGGYYIRNAWVFNDQDVEFCSINIVQPGQLMEWPVIGPASGQGFVAQNVIFGDPQEIKPLNRAFYVPPGWELMFRGLDNVFGAPVQQESSFVLQLDAPSTRMDRLRSHKGLWWPTPIVLEPIPA